MKLRWKNPGSKESALEELRQQGMSWQLPGDGPFEFRGHRLTGGDKVKYLVLVEVLPDGRFLPFHARKVYLTPVE